MTGKTIAEQILSAKSGTDARAGDLVVCQADLVIGTDASTPMAIDYFEAMGAERLHDPSRVLFAFDHYSPPTLASTRGFHDRMRQFVRAFGGELHEVGAGISFQIATERGQVLPGSLVIGADSHTVTCGALNAFATGVGSSDLAAALMTGDVWLRVPESIRVSLTGERPAGVSAKDIALALVAEVGPEGANYCALEFHGPGLASLTLEDRLVIANLGVEMNAKAALFPFDRATAEYLTDRTTRSLTGTAAAPNARYLREFSMDLVSLTPRVALPHAPHHVVPLADATDVLIHMVFLGTCTGGRVPDLREAALVLRHAGGRVAPGVQLVVTPASAEVRQLLTNDGTLDALVAMGATVTETGCGACCGTSGVIPGDGMNVLSTANRNFKARMGSATASIYLASPAACAAAAATGRITDPRPFAQGS